MPGRIYFGRLERTRYSHWLNILDQPAAYKLEAKLTRIIRKKKITAVHAIAHSCWDSIAAFRSAKVNDLPFFLTVHDDPEYCLKKHPLRVNLLNSVVECWLAAEERFVISERMGCELSSRWGKKSYSLITDGLAEIRKEPRPVQGKRLSVYFMGILHMSYEPNFVALQRALQIIAGNSPGLTVSLTLRGGIIRPSAVVAPELLRLLPFASDLEVVSDLDSVDVLYLPLAMDPEHKAMSAFSLSTKLISYLGAGLPIFYHGPKDSAAAKLLIDNNSAFYSDSEIPENLARVLLESTGEKRAEIVTSALSLANSRFQLSDIMLRFWAPILSHQ
jgi:hypothetical protein